MIAAIEESDAGMPAEVLAALNKLMKINNDRARFYAFALSETADDSLRAVFSRYLTQSKEFMNGLSVWILSYGGSRSDTVLALTWRQRFWMKVRKFLPSVQRGEVINSIEYREAKSVKSYRQILSVYRLPYEAYIEIKRQKDHVEKAFMEMITLSDAPAN